MMRFEGNIGENINNFAERMVKHFRNNGKNQPVLYGDFNGITLEVRHDTTPEMVVQQYSAKSEERHEQYINSPEYKEYQQKRTEEIKKLNSEVPLLMDEFRQISAPDSSLVLGWLCKIQPYTERTDVLVPTEEILRSLESLSYQSNANTDENFDEDDCENYARYIIGQAMAGLESMGAIHPMCNVFTERWKTKFGIV